MQDFVQSFEGGSSELLQAIRLEFPRSSIDEQQSALLAVAKGSHGKVSRRAAEVLCWIAELGDPISFAFHAVIESRMPARDSHWVVWTAAYSTRWICSSGLAACYFEFDERHFADRLRVLEVIGAFGAVDVLREADQLFGSDGPPASADERSEALTDEVWAALEELNPRFWACDDDIEALACVYAYERPDEFRMHEEAFPDYQFIQRGLAKRGGPTSSRYLYRCALCGAAVRASKRDCFRCCCGSMYLDADAGRLGSSEGDEAILVYRRANLFGQLISRFRLSDP